jgi:GDP-4-dehydro-6-deoxy-D-mannose reductase
LASLAYFDAYGLDIIRLRPFNHTGPGQSEKFVASDFAKAVARAEAGLGPKEVRVGSLSAKRDFLDVRDVVRAYYLAFECGRAGEVYNIASGRAYSIKEILDVLLGMSEVALTVEVEEERLRSADEAVLLGSAEKFTKLTNWRPEIPLETTLKDLLAWWRKRINS